MNNTSFHWRGFFVVGFVFVLGLLALSPHGAYAMSSRDAALMNTTNRIRTAEQVQKLRYSPTLQRAAAAKARDMFRHQYFAHNRPGRSTWYYLEDESVHFGRLGENLALGRFSSPTEVTSVWMQSPPHRANLINPRFSDVGASIISGSIFGRIATVVVEVFGGLKVLG